MKTIVIKTQKELDILPSEFKEYTIIEIRADKLIKVSKAYDNSSIQAYGNSSVEAYGNSSVIAYDDSSLERGIVYADGIMKQLISKRRYKGLDVFKVKEYSGKKYSYVVKRGNTFAHAETVKKAIEDLRYKISDRDLTKFNKLTLKSKLKIDDAIQCYRMITGACELGTREFVEKHKLPKTITIDKIIKLTKGQFGNDAFKEFFKGK